MKLEMKKVTTDTAEIQRIIGDYYELHCYYCMTINTLENVADKANLAGADAVTRLGAI